MQAVDKGLVVHVSTNNNALSRRNRADHLMDDDQNHYIDVGVDSRLHI